MRERNRSSRTQTGFSLIELLITLAVMLTVSAVVLSLTYDMTVRQASVANRSDMHSSVRSVTQMLQQELTQAGRVSWAEEDLACNPCEFPFTSLAAAVDVDEAAGGGTAPLTLDDPGVLFDGMRLLVDIGDAQELVIYDLNADETFKYDHADGAQVRPAGAFVEGILPISDGYNLHMFGDVNDDGQMVYIRYICEPGTLDAPGRLRRIQMPWDTPAGNFLDFEPQILLSNVICNEDPMDDCNPDTIPCFTYQQKNVSIEIDGVTTVYTATVNVGVTLTAKAEFDDMQTGAAQVETKALLNVSPRNVFEAWELSAINGGKTHVQPTPANITDLSDEPNP
jgi:prepilin-type N-terminal cleavage/methylation domain-containing protein